MVGRDGCVRISEILLPAYWGEFSFLLPEKAIPQNIVSTFPTNIPHVVTLLRVSNIPPVDPFYLYMILCLAA
jgi:hypothetical protein